MVADVNAAGATVVAIDLPSGPVGRYPRAIGPALEADLTVTLAAPKVPLVLPPAEHVAGDVVIADIGIPVARRQCGGTALHLMTRDLVRALVQPRAPDSTRATAGGW